MREINYSEKSSKRMSRNLVRNSVGVVDGQFDFWITWKTREINSMWLFVHPKYFGAAKVGGSAANIDFRGLRHSSASVSEAVQKIAERAAYTCLLKSPSPQSPAAAADSPLRGLGRRRFPFPRGFQHENK